MFKENISKIKILLNPSKILEDQDSNNLNLNQKIWQLVQIVCFSMVLAISVVLLTSNIVSLFGYEQADNSNLFAGLAELPIWTAFLLVVVIGPLLEELAFRLPVSVSPRPFLFGLPFLVFYLSDSAISFFLPVGSTLILILVGSMLVLTVLFCLFFEALFPPEKITAFLKTNFSWIFWTFSILFSLVHAGNYNNLESFWYLIPLLVLPQFLVGLSFGFIRVKYGFEWSFFAHSLYNFLISLPIFLLSAFAGNLEEVGNFFNQILTIQTTNEDLSEFLGGEVQLAVFGLFLLYSMVLGVAIYSFVRLFSYLKNFTLKPK